MLNIFCEELKYKPRTLHYVTSVFSAPPQSYLYLVSLQWINDLLLLMCCVSFDLDCRWWAGEWQKCSTTCGPTGEKKRTVLCIQTVGSDEQALAAKDCQHLLKPKTHLSCNRDVLCPSDWTVSNWTEVNAWQSIELTLLFGLQISRWKVSAERVMGRCKKEKQVTSAPISPELRRNLYKQLST